MLAEVLVAVEVFDNPEVVQRTPFLNYGFLDNELFLDLGLKDDLALGHLVPCEMLHSVA